MSETCKQIMDEWDVWHPACDTSGESDYHWGGYTPNWKFCPTCGKPVEFVKEKPGA